MRTLGYRDAIEGNAALIKGKTVLDVGCGTGVLSMMCVRAGAAHVIAIDASDIVDHAKRIVAANKMSEKITVIRGTMETLKLPAGVTKVDVIGARHVVQPRAHVSRRAAEISMRRLFP